MIWCLGMYSSASTWTFNVVQKIVGVLAPTRPVVPVFASDEIPPCDEGSATLVVKSHATKVDRAFGRRAEAMVISIRDPRDAIASLMRHNKTPFDLALRVTEASAATCARFVSRRRSILLRFEDRFFDDPATVDRIAALFPQELPRSDSQRIFEELRRDSVDEFIANLDTLATAETTFDAMTGQWDTYDPATGWHKHHAGRVAAIGRWRSDLSEAQAVTIQRHMQPWMERFGYLAATPRPGKVWFRVGRYEIVG